MKITRCLNFWKKNKSYRLMILSIIVHISHRRLLERIAVAAGIPQEQAAQVYRSVDKLDKIGVDGVIAEMVDGGIETAQATQVLDMISISGSTEDLLIELSRRLQSDASAEGAIAEMTQLFQLLHQMGVPSDKAILDLTLARGLDYYLRTPPDTSAG